MHYKEIIKKYKVIQSVEVVGLCVIVNGDCYQYKYKEVAKVVARNISAFIGVL